MLSHVLLRKGIDKMEPLLPQINSPRDLQGLSIVQLEQLAQEMRETLCHLVSNRTAHFASNLGVVELCIALHTVFDFSVARALNRWLELNFAMDNMFNKTFYETYERYTSRLPGEDPLERVHATTGYPRTMIGGLTIHLFPKGR